MKLHGRGFDSPKVHQFRWKKGISVTDEEYGKAVSAFYGVGGVSRLIRLMRLINGMQEDWLKIQLKALLNEREK